ncbi:site-specific integrase [Bordetella petrii]|uniref:Integrase/recombinase n=1 Tax=Bordetella petrii (strain ATCC BAA-461 / DSM 12804 / CCUG 43448 / CIP 107267 / Se-1111R) TaxID=340100 RepID=A9IB51_BORPD|nr:site-specific integrase [Bordetella petrii]CAP41371.1 Tyrosine recombinase xerD [Bordetella petrii]CAP41640.1 putative integrase/recombinase [Bordetella petrii]
MTKHRQPTDFAYALSKFLGEHLAAHRGMSANTVASYRDTFSILLRFMEHQAGVKIERICIADLHHKQIQAFLLWLEQDRGNSVNTRNQRLSAITSFFRFVMSIYPEHILLCQQILNIQFKKRQSSTVDYLSIEAVELLLQQPNARKPMGRRDLVLLSVLYDTGARVQELANMNVSDLKLTAPATARLLGKGAKVRLVPLLAPTTALLVSYLQEHHGQYLEQKDRPLFCNNVRKRLTRAGISYILQKYAREVSQGNPGLLGTKISPHTLRHSKAMHLLQAGVNLIYIRDLLGHSDIKTTEIYARADLDSKKAALEMAYPGTSRTPYPAWGQDGELLSWLQSLGKDHRPAG